MRTLFALVIAACSSLAAAQQWTLDTTFNAGETLNTGHGPDYYVTHIHAYPDGRALVGGRFNSYNHQEHHGLLRVLPDGTPDPTFATAPLTARINCFAVQPDGKILVGGMFTAWGGYARGGIVRLLADGHVDTTFSHSTGVGYGGLGPGWRGARCIAVQEDGRILVGGLFFTYDGVPRNGLLRLLANGLLDTTFVVGSGTGPLGVGSLISLAISQSGEILIGGMFDSYNGTARGFAAILDSTGGLTAALANGFDAPVWVVRSNAAGSFLVGGEYEMLNGEPVESLVRLYADGTRDTNFLPDIVPFPVGSLLQQADGRLLVGMMYDDYQHSVDDAIVRLHENGMRDTSFRSTDLFRAMGYPTVSALAFDSTGRVWVGGTFDGCQGIGKNDLIRLLPDGSVDASFNPSLSANGVVTTLHPTPEGKVYLIGDFSGYDDFRTHGICRLLGTGSLDTSFSLTPGPAGGYISTMALQTDGKPIVIGAFTKMNGVAHKYIARLNTDGSLDTAFATGLGTDYSGRINMVDLYVDGRVLIVGDFDSYDGVAQNGIARLHPDGSLDTSFEPGSGPWDISGFEELFDIHVLPDDRTVVVGRFSSFDGQPRPGVVLLEANGSVSSTWAQVNGLSCSSSSCGVRGVTPAADDTYLLWGSFHAYGGLPVQGFARIDLNGSLDTSFSIGSGADGSITSVKVRNDGRYLVAGSFTSFNGTPTEDLVCLNPDGSVHQTLPPGFGPGYTYLNPALNSTPFLQNTHELPDQRVLVCARFTEFSGVPKRYIARLNNDFTTSVSSTTAHDTLLHPNPTNGTFTVNTTGPATITVYDVNGRLVLSETITGNNVQRPVIDLSGREAGLYVVKVNDGKRQRTARVVKQ